MKIAVSGSHGLVGTALLKRLRALGRTVVRLDRHATEPDEAVIPWPDGRELDPAHLEDVDAIVHLAGAGIGDKRWTADRKRLLVESRVDTADSIATAVNRCDRPPRVLVSASAVGYYGTRGDEVLTEESANGTGFLADLCRRWEQAAAAADTRVACARTAGIVVAAANPAIRKQLPLFKLGLGGRIGNGRQWLTWISLADEVEAIVHLVDHDISGPVNLVGPQPVRYTEFAKTLGKVLHRPAVVPVPAFAPALLLGREAVAETIMASQRALPAVLERSGFHHQHESLEEALRVALDSGSSS